MTILPLSPDKTPPFDLLEAADPSQQRIQSYLKTGDCFIAIADTTTVGVLVVDRVDATTLEIKNIAVQPSKQGQGIGKALLRHAETIGRKIGYPSWP